MTFLRSRLTTVALAAVLLLGAAACSDDSDDAADTSPPPAEDTTSEGEGTTTGGGDATAGDDSGRPFGVDDEGMAASMKAATRADRVEVDGSTFRLFFGEGSVEDMSANINCTAMASVKGDEDSVVLVYPDGERPCED